jgi:hypothetical protein
MVGMVGDGGCLPTALEVCNVVDDDCDGRIDEGLGLGNFCSVGVGACTNGGTSICGVLGAVVCSAIPLSPEVEVCDVVDNDCDGEVDEGFGLGDACTQGVGACRREGFYVCTNDGGRRCATLEAVPGIETCNAVDDDCDGATDEGVVNACGVCGAAPVELCNFFDDDCDGAVDEGATNACGTCGALPPEACNSVDDDCDGTIDEGC